MTFSEDSSCVSDRINRAGIEISALLFFVRELNKRRIVGDGGGWWGRLRCHGYTLSQQASVQIKKKKDSQSDERDLKT